MATLLRRHSGGKEPFCAADGAVRAGSARLAVASGEAGIKQVPRIYYCY